VREVAAALDGDRSLHDELERLAARVRVGDFRIAALDPGGEPPPPDTPSHDDVHRPG